MHRFRRLLFGLIFWAVPVWAIDTVVPDATGYFAWPDTVTTNGWVFLNYPLWAPAHTNLTLVLCRNLDPANYAEVWVDVGFRATSTVPMGYAILGPVGDASATIPFSLNPYYSYIALRIKSLVADTPATVRCEGRFK
jgi:hypothetical protein